MILLRHRKRVRGSGRMGVYRTLDSLSMRCQCIQQERLDQTFLVMRRKKKDKLTAQVRWA